ncbi:unnamed protein product [Gordionus sp. m RMFG-2023]|uniref:uncharacterized protein LOC135929478 n=1 Tax=Gordionus sp. m RMFG-2023 TaxID=3053472 RepID=UPI0030E10AB1
MFLFIFLILISNQYRYPFSIHAKEAEVYYDDLNKLINEFVLNKVLNEIYYETDEGSVKMSLMKDDCQPMLKESILQCINCVHNTCQNRVEECHIISSIKGSYKNTDVAANEVEKTNTNRQLDSTKSQIKYPHSRVPSHHFKAPEQVIKSTRCKRGLLDIFQTGWEAVKNTTLRIFMGSEKVSEGVSKIGDGIKEDYLTPAFDAIKKMMAQSKAEGGKLMNNSVELLKSYEMCRGIQDCYEKLLLLLKESEERVSDFIISKSLLKNNGGSPKVAEMSISTIGETLELATRFLDTWTNCEGLENCQKSLQSIFVPVNSNERPATDPNDFLQDVKKSVIEITAIAFETELGKNIKNVLKEWYNNTRSFIPLFNPVNEVPQTKDLNTIFKGVDEVWSDNFVDAPKSLDNEGYRHSETLNTAEDSYEKVKKNNPSDYNSNFQDLHSPYNIKRFRRSTSKRNSSSVNSDKFDLAENRLKVCLNVDKEDYSKKCNYILGECKTCEILNKNCYEKSLMLDQLLYKNGLLNRMGWPVFAVKNITIIDQTRPQNYENERLFNSPRLYMKFQIMGYNDQIQSSLDVQRFDNIMDLAHELASQIWQNFQDKYGSLAL